MAVVLCTDYRAREEMGRLYGKLGGSPGTVDGGPDQGWQHPWREDP